MRKINVELNVAKLATKKIQLSQIENRMYELSLKYEALNKSVVSKQAEIAEIEDCINKAQSTPAVPE